MVTEKQRANLAKGRQKGIKRKGTANKCDQNNTFAAIFHFIESCKISDTEWDLLKPFGITRERMLAAGITDERKLKKCVNIFIDDSPATVREYLQRSEPQDIGVKLNFPALTDEQVNRIADGEDPRTVLASPGAGGA